jgi:2-dehydro-3-deoxygalactonokinase
MQRGGDMSSAFIAIDWGTTNRRIYLIVQGKVVRSDRDDTGALAMAGAGYSEAIASIRSEYGDLPVLMAGMVGSSLGWSDAGYIGLPAAIPELAASLHWIDSRTAIVPGLSIDDRDRTDVMRGEEVQLLGAVAKGLVPRDAWLCQPGTHCKWAEIKDGRITNFITAMSGELFALLRKSGVLAHHLTSPVQDNDAFAHGVAEGAGRDLAASLFSVRSLCVLGKLADKDASSFASGILIGSDVACRLRAIGAAPVYILADVELGGLYRRAVLMLGGKATLVDSHAAFVAGITAIWDTSR